MDNAPHALDVLSHVLDSPIRRVTAGTSRATGRADVEDSAEILFATGSGQMGQIALSWTYFSKDLDYLVVHGTEGTLRVGWTGGLRRKHGEREWTPFGSGYDKTSAFGLQLGAIREALTGPHGAAVTPKLGVGFEANEFVEAAYRALDDGSWVSVEEEALTF